MTIDGRLSTLASTLRHVGRALRHRNFRIFFLGQGVSVIGTWMQFTALPWVVYTMTGSNSLLGIVLFCGQLPVLLLTPLAGVVADRFPKRPILIVTQTLAMLQAFALAALFYADSLTPGYIILLAVFLGIVNAFDMPTRQAFVVEMVHSRDDLSNAIALNSFLFNGARLIGPTLAGFLLAIFGAGVCFLANALSFLAVILAFFLMSLAPRLRSSGPTHLVRQFADGVSYAWHFPPIRAILLLLALVSLVGMPYAVLMPHFAKVVFAGDARTLGFLMAATAVGALLGALYLAARKSISGLVELIPLAVTVFGVSLILFSFSTSLLFSLLLLAGAGFGTMVSMAASNTILQTVVPDDMRGRVMSLFTMSFMGMAPFGSIFAGFIADHIGPPRTIFYAGLLSLVGASVYALRIPALSRLISPHIPRPEGPPRRSPDPADRDEAGPSPLTPPP